jgi:aminoglycoside phosphotransferase (APT) family kinase protein
VTVSVVADLQCHLRQGEGSASLVVRNLQELGGGHSGFMYSVELTNGSGDDASVLRLSPPNVRISGPADVGRQGRIMAALHAAGLPVPGVIACTSEPVVDGRAFLLMERIDGETWAEARERLGDRRVAELAVGFLRRLHGLAAAATGIADEPVASPLDEVTRWARLLDRCPAEVRTRGEALAAALAGSAPPSGAPSLVHGDYHYGNLLFGTDEVAGVVDWEIAALGEPLLDLGSLAVASLRRRYAPEPNPTGFVDVAPAELVDLYGAEPRRATWCIALSCLKYAAIMGYNLDLHRRGKRIAPIYEQLGETTRGLVDDGVAFLADGIDARRR